MLQQLDATQRGSGFAGKKCTKSVSDSGLNIQEYALMIFNEEQQQPLRELLEKSTHGHHDIMMSPTLNAGVRKLQPLEDFYCFN